MSNFQNALSCRYLGVCGGCPWLGQSLKDQRRAKQRPLEEVFRGIPIGVVDAGDSALRDRVDLTLEMGKIGLWSQNENQNQSRKLVDLEECPMMSADLEAWFKTFRKMLPPVERGSIRLRVGPGGQRGVWLDFSNEDVQRLFEEKNHLKALSEQAIVEIGQRKKTLYFEGERPRLAKSAKLNPWFETYDRKGNSYPVFGTIGSFTQPGFKTNKVLVGEVLRLVEKSQLKNWVEAFCGSGNFTLPLASVSDSVFAVEVDELGLEALALGLEHSGFSNVEFERVDLKSARQTGRLVSRTPFSGDYGLLVDPPRSGLMSLLNQLEDGLIEPKVLVYVSCYAESLKSDVERLKHLGYQPQEVMMVDQFPHSSHAEWVVSLSKK